MNKKSSDKNSDKEKQQQQQNQNKNQVTLDNFQNKLRQIGSGALRQNNYIQIHDQIRSLTTMEAFQDSKYPAIIDLYELGPQIGKGSYAVVVLGKEKKSKSEVAVKRYHKKRLMDPGKMRNVKREIQILSKINHPNIMKLYNIADSDEHLNLIMEYIGGTSLYQYLKTRPQRRITDEKCRQIIIQVIQGIGYLHNKRIVHRDIKLENILIDEYRRIKLIDFGFSVKTQEGQKLTSFCGTPSYMSPEIVSKQEYTGFPSDIWSIGILTFVLLCGQFPFKGENEKDLFNHIKRGKFSVPEHVPLGPRIFIQTILKVNPKDRPTAQQLLNDQWIRQGLSQSQQQRMFQ